MDEDACEIKSLAKQRGEEEEMLLRKALEVIGRTLSSPCFSAKEAVFIPTETGAGKGFAETDGLFISKAGIFVFECKHMTGTVIGKVHDRLWTKTGETVLSFPNPILQSKRHAEAAAAYFGVQKDCCRSFAVFNDTCTLDEEIEREILRTGTLAKSLAPYLKETRLSSEALDAVLSRAEKLSPDEKLRKKHAAYIEKRKKERRSEKKRR
ncbi:MAG: nuclease-related domain-containing protein [Methanocorpusculum sp.]|nr:nuclease-related domain-containing protein [Methanocorpusculum sp.]